MKSKKNQGITLIALAVTIIVMLILAGATMAMLTGNSGILTNAKKAKENTRGSDVQEEVNLALSENGMADYVGGNKKTRAEIINKLKEENKITEEEVALLEEQNIITIGNITIDFSVFGAIGGKGTEADVETNYVGYYADIDGDGDVDGIIYADLLHGESGRWGVDGTEEASYTIPTLLSSEVKEYIVSSKNYIDENFGENKIIMPTEGTTGKERFYIMELKNFGTDEIGESKTYTWYSSAYNNMTDYETYTSTDFGKGKENTIKMIERWNKGKIENGGYGAQNDGDIWGKIQEKVNKGWFVPSRDEWNAFGNILKIEYDNEEQDFKCFSDGDIFWTSSQYTNYSAYVVNFNIVYYMQGGYYNDYWRVNKDGFFVRLSAKF